MFIDFRCLNNSLFIHSSFSFFFFVPDKVVFLYIILILILFQHYKYLTPDLPINNVVIQSIFQIFIPKKMRILLIIVFKKKKTKIVIIIISIPNEIL